MYFVQYFTLSANANIFNITISAGQTYFYTHVFLGTHFICAPDRARKRLGAHNRTQCAHLIEKQLETIFFSLSPKKGLAPFIFVVISSKVFAISLLQCNYCLNYLLMD